MKVDCFRPAFVSDIPDDLDEGVLYLALEYDAMVHLCACGCGCEISTPIGPTDWKIAWDGVGITVRPSVGNGSLRCRSHYVIDAGKVRWYPRMTDLDIAEERTRTARAKGVHPPPVTPVTTTSATAPVTTPRTPWYLKVWRAIKGDR